MPLCTLHLLSLTVPIRDFLSVLKTTSITPVLISKVLRWIIPPTSIALDPLLSTTWDILLILPSSTPLPQSLLALTKAPIYSLTAGVPSSLLENFAVKNKSLLHPPSPSSIPALTASLTSSSSSTPHLADSTQDLELTSELKTWIHDFHGPRNGTTSSGAVSMLNLLAFKPGKHASYLAYGKAFAESIGSRRGGNAKIVGKVVSKEEKGGGGGGGGGGWEEVAVAHYPSLEHFADMLASEDYQVVNRKYRVPSLRDTCILCTSEVLLEEEMEGEGGKEKERRARGSRL